MVLVLTKTVHYFSCLLALFISLSSFPSGKKTQTFADFNSKLLLSLISINIIIPIQASSSILRMEKQHFYLNLSFNNDHNNNIE